MQASTLYQSIYNFFGETTPLYGDCGTLCGKVCCADDAEEETGMYLFPGEKPLFVNRPGFFVVSSDFVYGGKNADLVICKEPCKRDLRPLSCRIFPLVPYYRKQTGLQIIRDPRAFSICPLASKAAYPYLNRAFIRKTESIFHLLIQFHAVRMFLEGLSDILDDYLQFAPKGESWI